MKFENWLTVSFLLGPRLGVLTLAAYVCGIALLASAVAVAVYMFAR